MKILIINGFYGLQFQKLQATSKAKFTSCWTFVSLTLFTKAH